MTTAPRTLAVATGELLRSRPATKMPGYVALEVVRPSRKIELWHVVQPKGVDALALQWAVDHGLQRADEPCPMCKSDAGFTDDTEDGLNRCVNCGCH